MATGDAQTVSAQRPAAAPAVQTAAAPALLTQYCLTCHSKPITRSINGKTISLTIDEAWVKGSVHRNHECTDCHTAYSKENHPAPKDYTSGRQLSHAASETCGRCHFDKAVKAKDSIHADLLAKGDQRAPGCSDCHGAHRSARALGIPSTAYPAGNAMRRFMMPTDERPRCEEDRYATAALCACHNAHDGSGMTSHHLWTCARLPSSYETDYRQRLPNPKAHGDGNARHATFRWHKRSIYLRFTDGHGCRGDAK
jgi:hypothetical protein